MRNIARFAWQACDLSEEHPNLVVRVYCWKDRPNDNHALIRFERVPVTELEGRPVELIASYQNGETFTDPIDAAPASAESSSNLYYPPLEKGEAK